ncbi:hypothetical protein COV24_01995 [candidate division WWE3 bacterium CG10_big_fil_rev_8_21_14_0_10_32_10]|uniref:Glycosyltransferase RgtA/B/C/D-like domain-containing protein n=1 Tax=candidate division WWE3 bacterium CG10_big_fil_rev_8_21_14_0_10_32_10 TaxID=1975090 RepID=A0A2H0RC15_UNCKA|nr:MAG: hypothetical protein COV24_01995 [candidate division WWE3 bacterium CG10_big_fil_rev_8_21_14_0_10_32_10]
MHNWLISKIRVGLGYILKNKKLFFILLFALILRVIGISYSLPLVFNVDEPSFVRTVIALRHDISPHRFDWPHLHFYLNLILYVIIVILQNILKILGLQNAASSIFPLFFNNPGIFYLTSRLFNAILGTLTIIPLYLSARILFKEKKYALYTSLLFSVFPYHIIESHLALLDVAMTFWVTWFVYISLLITKKPTYKRFLLSGIFMGLAFATKYTAFFYYLFFALCSWYSIKSTKYKIKKYFSRYYIKGYLISLLSFLSVFLITNFSIFFEPKLFFSNQYGRGFLFVFSNAGNKGWSEYPFSLFENFYTQGISDYGLSIYVFILLAFILFLFFNYRKKQTYLTILLPLFVFFYFSGKDRSPSHYFVFIYPLIALFVIQVLHDLSKKIYDTKILFAKIVKKLISNKKPNFIANIYYLLSIQNIFIILFILAIISPLYKSIKNTYLYSQPDTRYLTYNWIAKNLSKSDTLYYYGDDLLMIPFDNVESKLVKQLDENEINFDKTPFYLLIGVEDLQYSDIMTGDMDTKLVKGGMDKFLRGADLELYLDNTNRYGPPIYLFKVKNVKD